MARCLPMEKMCDKTVDCLGGEDEMNCQFARSTLPDNLQQSVSTRSATNSNELLTTIHTEQENIASTNISLENPIKNTKGSSNAGNTKAAPNKSNPISYFETSGINKTDPSTTVKRKNEIETALYKADVDNLFPSVSNIDDKGRRGDIDIHNYEGENPEIDDNLELNNFNKERNSDVTDDSQIFTSTSSSLDIDFDLDLQSSTTMDPFTTTGPNDISDNITKEIVEDSKAIEIDLPSLPINASKSLLPNIVKKPTETLVKNSTDDTIPINIESRVLPLENKNDTAVLSPATPHHEHKTPIHFLCNR